MAKLIGTSGSDTFDVDSYNGSKLTIKGKGDSDAVFANGITDMKGWVIDLGVGFDGVDLIQGTLDLTGTEIFVGVELLDTWGTTFNGVGGDNIFDFRGIQTYAFGTNWSVNVLGNKGNDVIYGGLVGDILDGGADNDVISGEGGSDTLTGGVGADVFLWTMLDGTSDVVADFKKGVDTLHFNSAALSDLLPLGALDAAAFSNETATAAAAQFIFHSADRTLWFDGDGTGANAEVAVASFNRSISASDIVIV